MSASPAPATSRVRATLALIVATACAGRAPGSASAGSPTPDPIAAAAELLAVDRAFAAAAERAADVAAGVAPMVAADVMVPVPGGFAVGRDSVLGAIRANPANAGARLGWTPVRVGVSADGHHGFTLGYATLHGASAGLTTPSKYLAYWVKGPEGWRAVLYRRSRAPSPGPVDSIAAALPAKGVALSADSAETARYRQSLDSTERAFSRDAQRLGLGPAFVRYGSGDAMNMGGPDRAAFVTGPDSIGALVAQDEPATGSSVSWSPDRGVIVASSGDLGVTIGTIVVNQSDSSGARSSFPFFTVWRRAGPDRPWRYLAE